MKVLGWLLILVTGSVVFLTLAQVSSITGDLSAFPAILLLGAFTVPAAFVAYIVSYERTVDREIHPGIPVGSVVACFIVGGLLGVVLAGIIEFATLSSLGIPQLFAVGFIEESVKLIFPIIYFARGVYRSEADGVLFGVASGMGFAALETVGYGLNTYSNSGGNIGDVAQVLIVRAIFSPAGHAAWTGYICGVLWRERDCKGRFVLSPPIVGAYLLAVVLHAVWNIISTAEIPDGIVLTGLLVIAALSVTILVRRLREARRRECAT